MPRSVILIGYSVLVTALVLSTPGGRGTVSARATQPGSPAIQILTPLSGSTLTSDDIQLRFQIADFTVDCAQSGRPPQPGVGHIHVMLDGLLVDLGCSERFTISGYGLAPGRHTLVALLADNQHHNLVSSNDVVIDYRPETPQPLPRGVALGTPAAHLVSPADGATVPARFPVVVDAINFVPEGGLSAKPNVAGYGQWLIRVDGKDVSYGMGTSFAVDATAWGPGRHTIGVLPVQNNHHGFAGVAPMEFEVVVDGLATPAPKEDLLGRHWAKTGLVLRGMTMTRRTDGWQKWC
jgi:hypothetical protein